ncbi:MAG: acetyl-CoA acetyltransferase [Halieaceae bacterium]|jgi:acetyl-CoA C-acetyltransferase|nr:acetyl-CoA acetyltransferase [Halieaceae bacterium]
MSDGDQIVVVGVAQHTWREHDVQRTPVDALETVCAEALADAGTVALRGAIDALVHVPFVSDNFEGLVDAMPRNPGVRVAERLGLVARQYRGDVGGNLPQYLVTEFAARLRRRECEAVMIMGVELLATFRASLRAGEGFPPWSSGVETPAECVTRTPAMTSDTELAHGLFEPSHSYSLFESSLRHATGVSAAEQGERLGAMIARMSEVAARNPHAARREALTAARVQSPEAGNRMIAFPYTKLMCAHLGVDQAAAVIITTAAKARALGIDSERWVYLRGAADCNDLWFLSERPTLHQSMALRIAAAEAQRQAQLTLDEIDLFDIYSCFPSALAVACDALGLSPDDPRGLSVTGGMSLFGGPGNNYSLHAIGSLVERLRATRDGCGMVTANGGYLTKHSVGVYSRTPGGSAPEPRPRSELQREVDGQRRLPVITRAEGAVTLDAHTVRFGREGPKGAIVLARNGAGERCLAVSEAPEVLEALLSTDCVGMSGYVENKEGLNYLRF